MEDSDNSTSSSSSSEEEEEVVVIEDPFFSLEIVGLKVNSNGRQCHLHECCGEALKVGDVVKLVRTVLHGSDGAEEDAIKAVKIVQGTVGCTVGFIPRAVKDHKLVTNHVDKFGIVQVIFEESDNPYLKQRALAYCGVAGVILLEDIPGGYS